jgi:hypothetical protein
MYPITLTIKAQISDKEIVYQNLSPGTLLSVVKGSKSKPAKELINRLLPVLEDLAAPAKAPKH